MQYFIDEVKKIYLKAGNGGRGAISFRREKYIERGGPNGGNGGRGGSIVFKSNCHINNLIYFSYKKHFQAANGQPGKGYNGTGKSRDALVIEIPIGTQIFSEDGNVLIYDFKQDKEEFEIIKGGQGGLGNAHFKSSTNQSPRQYTHGTIGEEMNVMLKLKLLSDAGLIGLPNVGKSTFLSKSTDAQPKIANYHFTTLQPKLGVVYNEDTKFVIADIPGLIKDAHKGYGLGDQFLKHIERCKVLIHILDATNNNIISDYYTIRRELESYSSILQKKIEILCINKIDLITKKQLDHKIQKLTKITGKTIYSTSGLTNHGINIVLQKTIQALNKYNTLSY